MKSYRACRLLLVLMGLALLIPAASPLAALEGQWSSLGPDGGSVYALAFQPGNDQVMYAGVDGGIYKSVNGGLSWTWAGQGLGLLSVSGLALDAVHTSTLYAVEEIGVYKSVNGGQSWARTGPASRTYSVAAHPRIAGTALIAAEDGLYRTGNAGATWRRLTRGLPRLYRANLVVFDPYSPNWLFASIMDISSGEAGLYKSVDGGNTWQPSHGGRLNSKIISAVGFSRRSPQTLYAGDTLRVFKSTDGGATWRNTGAMPLLAIKSLEVLVSTDPLRRRRYLHGSRRSLQEHQ